MRFSWALAAVGASNLAYNVAALAATDSIMDADSAQTGYLPNHNMDPAVISGGSFGQIWTFSAPGGVSEQFYAKPLVYTPLSTGRQIVLSFSEQNRIYALDAVNGTLYASRDLGTEGEIPFKVSDLGQCNDISGSIGITGTPVIDPATDTVYFWAKSYLGTATGYQNGAYRFHAIDAVTLQERPGFPTNIQGTPSDNDATRWFTGGTVLQRPSLNIVNGVVFAGFGGHCDQYNYTGWIVGMSATSGKLLTSYTTSGGLGAPKQDGTWTGGGGGAAVWMSGAALASDQSGRLFFTTGNGYKTINDGQPASGKVKLNTLSECVVNMAVNPTTGVVTQQDYFEPYTYRAMDQADRDLGSGGVSLPDPATFSGGGVSRIAITVGKNGVAYVLNADNLGGYKLGLGGTDAIIQTITMPDSGSVFANTGTYPLEGGFLYITPAGHPTLVYSLGFTSSGLPAFTLVAQSADNSAVRVGTGAPTITTYKGQAGTAILWVMDPDAGLRAYNAVPVNGALTQITIPPTPSVSKFGRPGFGDGRYYISTSNGKILAYGSPVALPLTCNSPVDFGSVAIGSSKTLTVTCTANIPITKITGFTLGKAVYTVSNSSLPTGPLAIGASFSFPVTFNLTNHVLTSGSTSSPEVAPGVQSSSISILTVNGKTGFAPSQPISLTGQSISSAPFLTLNPLQVTFAPIVIGSVAAETGSDSTFIINNVGLTTMTILGMAYTDGAIASGNANMTNVTTIANSDGIPVSRLDKDGYFTSPNMPAPGTTLKGGGSMTVSVNFNSNVSSTYYTMLQLYTDGGNAYTILAGSAATDPIAKLEYSTKEGGWNPIPHCDDPIAGCVSEINFSPSTGLTTETIQLRLSNTGGSALRVTKSKPLEGIELGATNPSTDFSEGLAIVPGKYALASVLFSPSAAILNADDVHYTGAWTLNTDDPTFGVHTLNFNGVVNSKKTGPVGADGNSIYKYMGCYQDYINNVRLESKQYVNANNSNGLCQKQAQAYGAVFAGTEYMSECWVGSAIPKASLKASDASCQYSCSGDATEACGGNGGYMSLYYDSTRYFPDNGTIVGGSTAGPSMPQTIGDYSYAGCYSDVATARVLVGKTSATSTMSLTACAAVCSTYNFFGVEYANECYCSNALGSNSLLKPDTDCSMLCAGNSSQFCGAGSRLSLYKKNGTAITTLSSSSVSSTKTGTASATPTPTLGFVSLGCYSDNDVTQRSLIGAATTDAAMTLEFCGAYCKGLGFSMFGTEYAAECYCGNSLSSSTSLTTDGRCAMACTGNPAEICGGDYGMNIYSFAAQNTTSTTKSATLSTSSGTSVSSSSTKITATSTSSPSATTTPTSAYVSKGCYTDNDVTERTLIGGATADPAMTIEMCGAYCKALGSFTYFGVEYGVECYCGSNLASTTNLTTDGRCSMPCQGNANQICGGSYGMNVYSYAPLITSTSSIAVSTSVSSTSSSNISSSSSTKISTTSSSASVSPTPSVPITIGDFTYLHCRSDNTTIRTLVGKYTATTDMTLDKCASSCTGYKYFGVEYYSECYCSNTLSVGSTITTDGRCKYKCLGNALQICGGSSGLTLYGNLTAIGGTSPSSSATLLPTSSTSASVSSTSSLSSVSSSTSFQVSSTSSLSSSVSSSVSSTSIATSSGQISSTTSQVSSSSSLSTSSQAPSTSSSVVPTTASSSSTSSVGPSSSQVPSTSSSSVVPTTSSSSSSSLVISSSSQVLSTSSSVVPTSSSTPPSSSFSSSSSVAISTSTTSQLPSSTSQVAPTSSSSLVSTTSSSSSLSSSVSKSSTSSVISSTSSTALPTVSSQVYLGCFNDTSSSRALVGASKTNTTAMTLDYCKSYCDSMQFPIYGLEYASQCYCSTGLTHGSVLQASGCTTKCAGDATQICGGSSRLSVYNNTAFIPPIIPATAGASNYTGCFTELVNSRAMVGYAFSNSTEMTPDLCVSTCKTKNYMLAAVQYGSECYCSNSISTAATQVADSDCKVLTCPGNKKQWCSAKSRLELYSG